MNVKRYPFFSATEAQTIFADAPINVPFPNEKKNKQVFLVSSPTSKQTIKIYGHNNVSKRMALSLRSS